MKKSIFGLLLVCLLQIDLAFAQNAMNGVVSDANGPLVGVVVYDKDNGKGTTSNVEGKYIRSVVPRRATPSNSGTWVIWSRP